MKNLFKLLIPLLFLMPLTALATTAAPWSITNVSDTFIFPNLFNGVAKGILVSASSTINSTLTVSSLTNGNCVQASTGGLLTTTAAPCSSSSSSFGTTSLSALFPIIYNTTTAQFSFGGLSTTSPWVAGQATYVVNNNTIASTPTTTASCSGSASCTAFTIFGSSPVTISATGGAFDPFTHPTAGQSATTSTMIFTTGGLVINAASSTIQGNLVINGNSTTTNATTTSLEVANLASTTDLIVSSGGGSGTRCAQFGADGRLSANAAACGSGSSSFGTSSLSALFPIIYTQSASLAQFSFGGLTTSSPIVSGQSLYATGVNTVASVSTSTPTVTSPITYSGTLGNFIGGVSGTFGCATCVTISTATSTITGTTGQVVYMRGTNSPIGTSSIFIDAAGKVGMGTITPTAVNANADLTVAGAGSVDIIASTTDNTTLSDAIVQSYADASRVFLGAHGSAQVSSRFGLTLGSWGEIAVMNSSAGNTNGLILGTIPAVPLVLGTNSFERARFLSTGEFGIGTTSPYALLSIMATSTAQGSPRTLFAIGSSTASATSTLFSISNIGSTTLASTFGSCSGSNALTTNSNGTIVCGAITGTGSASSTLLTDFNTFTGRNMFLASTTIGDGTQGGGLTINGGATTTGNSILNSNLILTSTATGELATFGQGAIGTNAFATFGNGRSSFGYDGVNTAATIQAPAGKSIRFNVNNDTFGSGNAMIITASANVGIGTTSPFAKVSIHGAAGETNKILFAIGSSTAAFATSTLFSISNIGSTTLATTFGSCSGSSALTTNSGGTIVCGAITGTGAASTTLLSDINTFTGRNMFLGSTTIGNGTQAGGLTVNGGATTTGNVYFASKLSIGTTTSSDVNGVNAITIQGPNATDVLNFTDGLTTGAIYVDGNATTNAFQFGSVSNKNFGLFTNNNTPQMSLNTNGGTLIGTYANSNALTYTAGPANGLAVSGSTGIGTTSPSAKFAVQANNGETNANLFAVASSTSIATTTFFRIDNRGNIITAGAKPSGSCGGASSITATSTDLRGTIVVTGSSNSCNVTFSSKKSDTPTCVVGQSTGAAPLQITAASTSGFAMGMTGFTGNIHYICMQ